MTRTTSREQRHTTATLVKSLMEGPLPASLPDAINRMVQLQYTSRIKLDQKLFNKIDRMITIMESVDAELSKDSPVRSSDEYKEMLSHRRIDSFTIIEAKLDHDLTNASDFSRSSIDARIEPVTMRPSAEI